MVDKKNDPGVRPDTPLFLKIINKTISCISYLLGFFSAFIVKWTFLLIGIFVWIALKNTSGRK